ncbi:MAG: choice-of-anchor B family protein, partial [Saprospiraceae bacterium]
MKSVRFTLLSLLATVALHTLSAQLNTTLVGQLGYESGEELSDIWGYVAPDGTEYALIGLLNGVSIVSLADPANPVEVVRLPGQYSIWRDLKTYGTYAYVVADQSSSTEGMTIIDLSNLPASATQVHLNLAAGGTATLRRAHNIYIDEATGHAYTTGGNLNGGAPVIFDIAATPGSAIFVANTPGQYSHDVFVRDGIMYTSNIYAGEVRLYDVSNPLAVSFLGSADTPNDFTHNAWPNDAGTVVFTTDERANAAVAAYDISDPTDISELDQFRPLSTLGAGVIPHNVHVLNDYVVTSHYTSGLVVIDGSRPENLIEVANYDTWAGGNGGFNGNWGAYPFLPSGLVLLSDIESGLYVVDVAYQRAAWLEGRITDETTTLPLAGVTVDILSAGQSNAIQTDGLGRYESGIATGGTFTVRISRPGYVT